MKLTRLAGQGPRAAITSGAAMIVVLLVWIVLSPDFGSGGVGIAAAFLFVLAATVWLAGMAIAGLDIDWIAHPGTHDGRMLASLWMAIGGAFLPPLIGVTAIAGGPAWVTQLLLCLVGLCAAGFTVLHNLEALRAGILQGALPWLGIIAGLFFLVLWLGILLGLVPLIVAGFFPGAILYAGWAIWLGIQLGAKTPVAAAVT